MSSCDSVSPTTFGAGAEHSEGVTYTPRKGSSQPLNTGRHPKNWSDVSMFWSSVPCIRSLKSAGQFIVNFVMGLMVGDRRFPGGDNTGGRFSTSSVNHRFSVPPACPVLRDGSFFLCIVTGSFCVLGLRIVVQAVAARRLVQYIVMDSLAGLFWDFGSLYQRRCGVVSDALSRQPSSLRRLWLGVAAQACGTSLSDISAFPTLRRRVSHAEERGVTDVSCCGSDNLFFLGRLQCRVLHELFGLSH